MLMWMFNWRLYFSNLIKVNNIIFTKINYLKLFLSSLKLKEPFELFLSYTNEAKFLKGSSFSFSS